MKHNCVHRDLSPIPVTRSFADPAPLSPPNNFLSALYCPVPIKPENAHKKNQKKPRWYCDFKVRLVVWNIFLHLLFGVWKFWNTLILIVHSETAKTFCYISSFVSHRRKSVIYSSSCHSKLVTLFSLFFAEHKMRYFGNEIVLVSIDFNCMD